MKKIIFIISVFVATVSCKKTTNDPMPAKKNLAVILTVVVDTSKPIWSDVIIVFKKDEITDTLTVSNYPSVFYFSIKNAEHVSFSSENKLDAYIKDDDGELSKNNLYAEFIGQQHIDFNIRDIY